MLIRRGNRSRMMIPGDAIQVREFIPSAAPVEFLFREDFGVDESAPMASPIAAIPGPGTKTVVDTGNALSVASGVVFFDDSSGSATVSSQSFTRITGLAMMFRPDSGTDFFTSSHGWDTNTSSAVNINGIRFTNSGIEIYTNGARLVTDILFVIPEDYFVVLRTTGAFSIKDDVLLWVGFTTTQTPLFARISNQAAAKNMKFDTLRVSQLPAPWDTDNGIATTVLAGVRSEGDTFTHEADCLIEFEATTLPGSGNNQVIFREQDDNNHWRIQMQSTGAMTFREINGGVNTTRISVGAGTISNGDRLVVIADGNVYKLYVENTLVGTYTDSGSFLITETSGRIRNINPGGVISDIISWPRVISGDALTALDAVAA